MTVPLPAPPARAGDRLHTGCCRGLLLVALWAPLPFASARPWAWGLLALLMGLLVAALALAEIIGEGGERQRLRPLLAPAVLFTLTLAWGCVQCLPWTPESWQHPLWQEAARLLPAQSVQPSISIDRSASWTALLRLLTYGAVFWVAFRCARESAWARRLVAWGAAIAMIYACWGLAVYWTGNGSVLWFAKWAYRDDLTSTFVNRNSFAAYSGLALVSMVGLLLDLMVRKIDFTQTRRAILTAWTELLRTDAVWLIGGIALTTTALLLTHSRAGAASAGVGIIALLAAAFLAPSLRGPWRATFALALAIGGLAALLVSGTATLGRVADTSWDVEGRSEIYNLTLQAIGNTPLLGTGLGTFKSIFPAYRPETLALPVEMAHDDYLQDMLELGIPAALTLFAAVLLLAARCAKGVFVRRRNAILPCIGLGATALVAFHSLFDFSLQIPAVTLSYLLILGAAVAQSAPTQRRVAPEPT
jgi:O-antigen ligase